MKSRRGVLLVRYPSKKSGRRPRSAISRNQRWVQAACSSKPPPLEAGSSTHSDTNELQSEPSTHYDAHAQAGYRSEKTVFRVTLFKILSWTMLNPVKKNPGTQYQTKLQASAMKKKRSRLMCRSFLLRLLSSVLNKAAFTKAPGQIMLADKRIAAKDRQGKIQ